MKALYVTDRAAAGEERLRAVLSALSGARDFAVQLREKETPDREALDLARRCRQWLGPGVPLYVNRRFDVALAAGADGVHLPSDGMPVARVRANTPRGFRIGVSTHSAKQACSAIDEGADLVLLGPIFETPSKAAFGAPLTAEALAGLPLATSHRTDVFAIGGISEDSPRSARALPQTASPGWPASVCFRIRKTPARSPKGSCAVEHRRDARAAARDGWNARRVEGRSDARSGPAPARGPHCAVLRSGLMGVLIGIDLAEVARVAGVLERHGDRFLSRVFHPGEINRRRRHPRAFAEHVAGRFAAKEAAMKALGTGWRGLSFKEIVIGREPGGKPLPQSSRAGAREGPRARRGLRRGLDHAHRDDGGGRRGSGDPRRANRRPRSSGKLRRFKLYGRRHRLQGDAQPSADRVPDEGRPASPGAATAAGLGGHGPGSEATRGRRRPAPVPPPRRTALRQRPDPPRNGAEQDPEGHRRAQPLARGFRCALTSPAGIATGCRSSRRSTRSSDRRSARWTPSPSGRPAGSTRSASSTSSESSSAASAWAVSGRTPTRRWPSATKRRSRKPSAASTRRVSCTGR